VFLKIDEVMQKD